MTTALDHVRPVAVPGRIGQGTAVEQSRAIAEVQAQVIVAQQMPRDINRANRDMLRSCGMKGLAEKAFYRYRRAGTQITGPSVQLAREMARCWGNIQYGITELRRDDEHGQSEMMAFAWDLETNTRSATTFIVQHVRDTTKDGPKQLTEQRDIYENNANNGARRLREMIFAILPGWYTEDAVAACYATLAGDSSDGATAAERAANAVARFAAAGVRQAQLENKLGAPMARWSPSDLAQLTVIWRSAERGETTLEAEFGAAAPAVTAADITGQQEQAGKRPARGARSKPAQQQDAPPPEDDAPWPDGASVPVPAPADGERVTIDHPAPDSPEYKSALTIAQAQAKRLFEGDRAVRLEWASKVLRTEAPVMSFSHLTINELQVLGDTFARCQNVAQLERLIAEGTAPDGQ